MNIIINTVLRQKYKGGQREPEDIQEITIHGTGGGTGQGIIAWMESDSCERKPLYKNGVGLFPYLIDRDGTVHEIMPPEDWYYHSEAGYYDRFSIGVELVNDQINNGGEYTEDQYKSLMLLMQLVCGKYSIKRITSHDHNRGKFSGLVPKPCPGPNFDKAAIEAFRDAYGYQWDIEI
jgi:hypothetical protein